MLLYDQIGNSVDNNGNIKYGISGTSFAWELQYLQDKCSKINVRINSIGGSVLDGYSIASAILSSKVPVDTYIDGLAASISGVIAVCGKKVRMMDYGTLMMHDASGSDDKEFLELVNNTIGTILSNRTSKTMEEIREMMKKETYLLADEALSMGLVDEVISTNKKIKVKKESLSNMALVYNKLIENKPKMEKVTNLLNLKNEATEQEIVSAIEAVNTENETIKSELKVLEDKVAEFEAKEKEAKEAAELELKNKATELVENAIKEKKVTEAEKDELIVNAISNFSFVSNMLSKINAVKNAVKVFDAKNVVTKKGAEDRSEWTIRDWEQKDPSGLMELKNSNEDVYNEMKDKFYKKQK
jgi:ATP-dependent protease ClpP protease subunit